MNIKSLLGVLMVVLVAMASNASELDARNVRETPEAMALKMRERFERRRSEENKRWQGIEELGKTYRGSTDEDERLKLKNEIEKQCGEIYDEQLNFGRQHLEKLKKRLEFLEKEQVKREKMRSDAIAFRAKHILSGEKMPPPPPGQKRHGDRHDDGKGKDAEERQP